MRLISSIVCALSCAVSHAQEIISSDEAFKRFGVDPATTEIRAEQLAPGLHVIYGAGGNVVASIGDDGVLIVDDQFPQSVPRIEKAIEALGGSAIDFVVNTHWHFDHADGNLLLGKQGSLIISHEHSRKMLLDRQLINLVGLVVEQPAYEPHGLPLITFDDGLRLHFNGDTVDVLHFGPAHTTGDAIVFFRNSKVVHMGDVFNMASYPFIDADNGGDLDGVIRTCEAVLQKLDEDAVVVPGHGRAAAYGDLEAYLAMLTTIRERVVALIDEGATLEEIVAARPTSEWDEVRGDPTRLLDRMHLSLTRTSKSGD